MKKILWLLILLPLSLWSYNRIVSLAPSITETLFYVGAGDQVAAVSRFCQYPQEALKKERIGGYLDINYEKIIRLKPDLVLCLPSDKKAVKKLKELKIPVAIVTQTTLEQIKHSIIKIGTLTGHKASALRKVKTLESKWKRINLPHKYSLLLIVGRSAGDLNQIYAAGNTGFYNEIINLAGASNAFHARVKIAYPVINTESLITLNPDVIIELADARETEQTIALKKKDWKRLPFLKAVKNRHIYYLKRDYSTIPGPRIFMLSDDINAVLKELQ